MPVNVSNPEYKNKNKRKTALEELVDLLQGSGPEVQADVTSIKATIQGLRSTFREEHRKCALAFTRTNFSGQDSTQYVSQEKCSRVDEALKCRDADTQSTRLR